MNPNKLIAIAGAFLIASAAVVGIRAWANASAHAMMLTPAAAVDDMQTLPAITVHPTRAQMDALRREKTTGAEQASAASSGGGVAMDMPYYSFGIKAVR